MKTEILTGLSYLVLSLALLIAAPKQETKLLEKLTTTKLANYQLKDDQSLTTAIKQISTSLKLEKNKNDLAKTLETTKIPAALTTKKIAKMGLGKVSVAEALDLICQRAGATWSVKNEEIVLNVLKQKKKVDPEIKKLERVILQQVEFSKDMTFRQGINFLASRVREYAANVGEETITGVGFIVRDKMNREKIEDDENIIEEKDFILKRRTGEFELYHLSAKEVLTLMCKRCNTKWQVENRKVVIQNIHQYKEATRSVESMK